MNTRDSARSVDKKSECNYGVLPFNEQISVNSRVDNSICPRCSLFWGPREYELS